MAGDKYVTFDVSDNKEKLKAAVQSSAGAGDAGKIPALDAGGKLDTTMMPDNIGTDVEGIVAGETLANGDFVNIYDDTGTRKVRKANATDGTKVAHGYVLVGVSSGSTAAVYLAGKNNVLSALTIGAKYFLSKATGGLATADVSTHTVSGNQIQALGVAIKADTIDFEFDQPIEVI